VGNYPERRILWVAGLVAAIWGLHPYLVSTVLYVVQRMTLLSATFSFIAFILYIVGRSRLLAGQYRGAVLYFAGGALVAGFALLSKENAVLIPLQLLLIAVFLRLSGSVPTKLLYRRGLLFGLILVSFVVCYNLYAHVDHHIWALIRDGRDLPTNRDFSFAERLLTECRVVGDYIISVLMPSIQTAGVFQDGYEISRSFTQPLSTLVFLVVHILLIVLALTFRKKLPVIFLGVLWFYVGHLVESTVVMLELKFEHRNYLPSIGLILPVAVLLSSVKIASKWRWLLTCLFIPFLALMLFARASLWGEPEKASLTWVAENPWSERALENAALVFAKTPGNYEIVSGLLAKSVEVSGGDPVLAIKHANYTCRKFEGSNRNWQEIGEKFLGSSVNWQVYQVLSETLDLVANKHCQHINFSQFNRLTNKVLENPKYRKTGTPKLIRELQARAALIFAHKEEAVAIYREQANSGIPLSMIMRQALWLASYGELEAASEILASGIATPKRADSYLLDQAMDMKQKIDAEADKN
jgi:hypothetical protein